MEIIKFAVTATAALAILGAATAASRAGITDKIKPTRTLDPTVTEKIKFREIAQSAGIHFKHQPYAVDPLLKNVAEWFNARGSAVAVADFNNDGFMDFYTTSSKEGSPNALYRNKGDGTFEEVGAAMGVADVNRGINSMSALWFDYDNDGWNDLYVVAMGCNRLFHNDQGRRFTDVTAKAGQIAGLPDKYGMCGSPSSVVAFDYNQDGLLDVFVANLYKKDRRHVHDGDTRLIQPAASKLPNGPPSYLFRNNGDGTFTDVAAELGVTNDSWAVSAGAGDVNLDGWPDLFVGNDINPDRLYINQGGKSFRDITRSALRNQYGKVGMSAEIVDTDGDEYPEIYSTKISQPGYATGRNELWKSADGLTFTNIANSVEVASCGWSWNARFVDIGHRGLRDLVVVNGLFSGDRQRSYWFPFNSMRSMDNFLLTDATLWPPIRGADFAGYQPNCVFMNTGDGYADIAKQSGVTDLLDGRGLATIDIRNDGRQSLLIGNTSGPVLLYENISDLSGNEWIGFQLKSHGRDAVGARVHVATETPKGVRHQYLEVNLGNGYASQSDARLVFGLGAKPAKIVEAQVIWPGGKKQALNKVEKNAYNLIVERD